MQAKKLSKSQPLAFQVSLRVRHPSMDPASISRELGIEAEHSFRAGDPRPSRSGLAPASIHTETYWLAPMIPASWLGDMSIAERPGLAAADKHMYAAVTTNLGLAFSLCALRFRTMHGALLRQIRSEGGQVSLLVALSAAVSSFSIAPEVSRLFSDLGITIEFEMTND
jgi:hypothetical protein